MATKLTPMQIEASVMDQIDPDRMIETIDPTTGRDPDDIPTGSIELMPVTMHDAGGVTHTGDLGRMFKTA